MLYRISERTIEVCNGFRCWYERRFIAERRLSFFGFGLWWWPVLNAEWRGTYEDAGKDIERDQDLRAPTRRYDLQSSSISGNAGVSVNPGRVTPTGPPPKKK